MTTFSDVVNKAAIQRLTSVLAAPYDFASTIDKPTLHLESRLISLRQLGYKVTDSLPAQLHSVLPLPPNYTSYGIFFESGAILEVIHNLDAVTLNQGANMYLRLLRNKGAVVTDEVNEMVKVIEAFDRRNFAPPTTNCWHLSSLPKIQWPSMRIDATLLTIWATLYDELHEFNYGESISSVRYLENFKSKNKMEITMNLLSKKSVWISIFNSDSEREIKVYAPARNYTSAFFKLPRTESSLVLLTKALETIYSFDWPGNSPISFNRAFGFVLLWDRWKEVGDITGIHLPLPAWMDKSHRFSSVVKEESLKAGLITVDEDGDIDITPMGQTLYDMFIKVFKTV